MRDCSPFVVLAVAPAVAMDEVSVCVLCGFPVWPSPPGVGPLRGPPLCVGPLWVPPPPYRVPVSRGICSSSCLSLALTLSQSNHLRYRTRSHQFISYLIRDDSGINSDNSVFKSLGHPEGAREVFSEGVGGETGGCVVGGGYSFLLGVEHEDGRERTECLLFNTHKKGLHIPSNRT